MKKYLLITLSLGIILFFWISTIGSEWWHVQRYAWGMPNSDEKYYTNAETSTIVPENASSITVDLSSIPNSSAKRIVIVGEILVADNKEFHRAVTAIHSEADPDHNTLTVWLPPEYKNTGKTQYVRIPEYWTTQRVESSRVPLRVGESGTLNEKEWYKIVKIDDIGNKASNYNRMLLTLSSADINCLPAQAYIKSSGQDLGETIRDIPLIADDRDEVTDQVTLSVLWDIKDKSFPDDAYMVVDECYIRNEGIVLTAK